MIFDSLFRMKQLNPLDDTIVRNFQYKEKNAVISWFVQNSLYNQLMPVKPGHPGIHTGFYTGYRDVKDQIFAILGLSSSSKQIYDYNNYRLLVTGHSYGGAIATIASLDIEQEKVFDTKMYCFGSPKVGNEEFCEVYNDQCKNSFRIVNENDLVISAPQVSLSTISVN